MYEAFERDLARAVTDGRIAGAVAMVMDRSGVTYRTAAGVRAAGAPAPMDEATVFWIASMTKAVVSVAALQQVERGTLTLDGDLADLLPDLAGMEVLDGFEADGTPRLRPARRAVTLRHLLTHTAGFGYDWLDADLRRWSQATGAASANGGVRAAHRQPLLFDPGEGWAYGINTDWVGLAVEAASGQRLDAYLGQHVFAPLGMTDTAFALSVEQEARRASLHVRVPDAGLAAMPFAMPADPEVLSGGGGLFGTAPDYGRFLRMLLNGGSLDGRQVLAPQTVALLGEVQTGEHRAGAFKTAAPGTSNDFDLFPDMHTGWGLTGMISPQAGPAGRSAGSLAWAGLFNTYYWVDPTAGIAGLLMAQLLPFGDPEILALTEALERGAYGA
jgi:methyl acetate hydrolase